ncbi:MAG: hypothetical protein Q8R35_01125 [bacterium]|nr:hypothetical protein [bacterium]
MTSTRNASLNTVRRTGGVARQRRILGEVTVGAFLLAACFILLSAAPTAEAGEPSNDLGIIATAKIVTAAQTLPIVIDGWCLNTQDAALSTQDAAKTTRLRCQVRAEKVKRVAPGGERYYLMVFTEDGREVQTISIYPVGEERVIYRREPK